MRRETQDAAGLSRTLDCYTFDRLNSRGPSASGTGHAAVDEDPRQVPAPPEDPVDAARTEHARGRLDVPLLRGTPLAMAGAG